VAQITFTPVPGFCTLAPMLNHPAFREEFSRQLREQRLAEADSRRRGWVRPGTAGTGAAAAGGTAAAKPGWLWAFWNVGWKLAILPAFAALQHRGGYAFALLVVAAVAVCAGALVTWGWCRWRLSRAYEPAPPA
jgi:hypothetical protein